MPAGSQSPHCTRITRVLVSMRSLALGSLGSRLDGDVSSEMFHVKLSPPLTALAAIPAVDNRHTHAAGCGFTGAPSLPAALTWHQSPPVRQQLELRARQRERVCDGTANGTAVTPPVDGEG